MTYTSDDIPRRFTQRELDCYDRLLCAADSFDGDGDLSAYEAQFILSMLDKDKTAAIDAAMDDPNYKPEPDESEDDADE